ncbi:MAG: zinc metallopeptidase [candidate division KSB1 bacterium]|nr:zinc metallopeptidase [candidate division KSB1 bacterium]MDZ7345590.1 zinc metallopeptidase [candidate division KSB1 bacterium]
MFLPMDATMIILIPAFILSLYAQYAVRSAYAKWSRVPSSSGMTGAQAAKNLLLRNGISDVEVEPVAGTLTDHYDPRAKKLRLSSENYSGTSLASIAVAAHETGHAIQHATSYAPLGFRNAIFPLANFGSTWGIWLFFIGLFVSAFRVLMDIGILLFGGAVLFQVITLPVEFNASRRALVQLAGNGYLKQHEIEGARQVLKAAALTYVAAAAMAILQLIRLLMIRGRND